MSPLKERLPKQVLSRSPVSGASFAVYWHRSDGFLEVCVVEGFSGLVLSGGQGRRMGGADKGLLTWCGLPMAEHVCRRLRPLVAELLVSCNRNPERYQAFCDRTLADADADYPGPLAGILRGLREMRGSHLLVVPCDLPAIGAELLEALQRMALDEPQQIVAVRQGAFLQPLVCVVPRCRVAEVEQAWQAGERSPNRLWQRLGVLELLCGADDPQLANLNCPEALNAAGQTQGLSDHP